MIGDAEDRLRRLATALRLAGGFAQVTSPGEVHLAVVTKRPDGSGALGATFEFEPFVADLELVLGERPIPPVIDEYAMTIADESLMVVGEMMGSLDKSLKWEDLLRALRVKIDQQLAG